jgi:hypothetical protein
MSAPAKHGAIYAQPQGDEHDAQHATPSLPYEVV